ncbi:hypothetical protein [Microbulbifer thermotolerans]|uniref:hypothetical protein n=1 Tax=Microbulbifer thermotolerans TaxID=252514 RepID=UPI0012E876E3|nr:hypothetical protein [Microbulbifer thermotolerans]
MSEFRNSFRNVAEEFMASLSVAAEIKSEKDRDVLRIPPQSENGFQVELECTEYGVYPSAEGWHGGCWDVTVWKPKDLEASLREFLNSIVTDAELEICYSGSKPYKWILRHTFEGQRVADETGLIFFNWFGRRSIEIKCNA